MSGTYIASKTRHAEKWRKLRAEGWDIAATWIDEAGPGETADFADLWRRCVMEACLADLLIVYAEPEDMLKGALVEVGAALGRGVPVVVVGDCPQFASWLHHPLVRRCESVEAALAFAPPLLSPACG